MTKRLEQGIEAIRAVSEERQDLAGEILLAMAVQHRKHHALSLEQANDVRLALAEADGGEYATDQEMDALWKKCGL